jgi:hypothetical protein
LPSEEGLLFRRCTRLIRAVDDDLAVIGWVVKHANDPQRPVSEPRRGLGVEWGGIVGLYPHGHLP